MQTSIDDQIRALIDSGGQPVTVEEITARPKARQAPRARRPRRAMRLGLVLTAAAATAAAGVLVITGTIGVRPGTNHPGGPKDQVTTAAFVRHIAAASAIALARSGKVTIVYHVRSDAKDDPPSSGTDTISFSGQDYNFTGKEFTAAAPHQAATRNSYLFRVVNGQAYNYFIANHGLRWYHVLGQYAVIKERIPDPRGLLRVLAPDARFVRAGTAVIDGVRTTKLRATRFSDLSVLRSLPEAGPGDLRVTALTVWAGSRGVIRQLRYTVRYSAGRFNLSLQHAPRGDTIRLFVSKHRGITGEELVNKKGHVILVIRGSTIKQIIAKARKAGLFDGRDIVSTIKVRVSFTDIGKPQHIVAPKHAITVHGVG